jgi:hypothetical protein
VRRCPRQFGVASSRWTLRSLGRAVPRLRGRSPGTVARLLARLGVGRKRGRLAVHSPAPAYDAKLAAITAAQAFARAYPERVVLLYEDGLTYHRRPAVAPAWARRGGPAPPAPLGLTTNKVRRVAARLDARTGRVIAWQRRRFDRRTLLRFDRAVRAAYPAAEVIYLAQDNWPVHTHPDVLAALPGLRIERLPLPTYAPWTDPVEDLWRGLYRDVLHQHAFADDWRGLQAAVASWLDQWSTPSPLLLRMVGLCPD